MHSAATCAELVRWSLGNIDSAADHYTAAATHQLQLVRDHPDEQSCAMALSRSIGHLAEVASPSSPRTINLARDAFSVPEPRGLTSESAASALEPLHELIESDTSVTDTDL